MASMKFIIENDEPKALACEGSTLDMVAHIAYLIGTVYQMLRGSDSATAAGFKKMIAIAVADPSSPIWDIEQAEGETTIAIRMPKLKSEAEQGPGPEDE